MSADKQIRFSIDDKQVFEAQDRIRREFEETQRRVKKTAEENKRLNRDEVNEINKKVKAYREVVNAQQEELRNEISNRKIGLNAAQQELERFKKNRATIAKEMGDYSRSKYETQTDAIVEVREASIDAQKRKIIDRQRDLQEDKTTSQKQIRELRNIVDTIKGEGSKTRRDNGEVLSRITSGGMTMMGGNLGNMIAGLLRFAGPAAAVGVLASAVINQTKERQNALTGFAAYSDLSNTEAVYRSAALRNPSLGLDAITASNKAVMFSRVSGLDLMRSGAEKDVFGLAGLQIARGFSDQQIQQLLTIQRYTGVSAFGQVNTLEEYTRRRDGNIVKLPEILDQYLKVANEILNRTGRVDASAIQQVLTSVGSSYGLSGVPLERMSSGIMNLGRDQGSGIMRAFRMETLRKMYPGMSTWDMMGKMEDPSRDPKYLQEIVNRSIKIGGGGDWTKFFLMSQGFSYSEVDKLMKGDFKLSDMSYGKSDDKMLQNKYLTEGESKIGNIQQLETSIGGLTDAVVKITSAILDGDLKTILFTMATPLGSVIATAINDHLKRRQ